MVIKFDLSEGEKLSTVLRILETLKVHPDYTGMTVSLDFDHDLESSELVVILPVALK